MVLYTLRLLSRNNTNGEKGNERCVFEKTRKKIPVKIKKEIQFCIYICKELYSGQ